MGYPMNGYVELAERSGYPLSLLNLTTAGDIRDAICKISSAETRGCLQKVNRSKQKRDKRGTKEGYRSTSCNP